MSFEPLETVADVTLAILCMLGIVGLVMMLIWAYILVRGMWN